jgi:hypothetical protein
VTASWCCSHGRSRGNNNLHLLELATGDDTLLTPHEGIAQYFGQIAKDGSAVYLGTNEGRDLTAFGRIELDSSGRAGKIEVLRERPDAELGGVQLNQAGTVAALMWNVRGRSELELYDLHTNRSLPTPNLPADGASTPTFSRDGENIAVTSFGATQPPNVWVAQIDKRVPLSLSHSMSA